ncbi:hypothetical protein [Kitasatospora sp. NPDC005856]|uniref:hypothetical protein n=1 Tax=Kitasatospora sp. NPDC005856 TaxID=3154566 RepID=UPI0033D24014
MDFSPSAAEIAADLIRNLMLGRVGGPPDPRGIRITGATITGRLDLTDVRSCLPLQLRECTFAEPVIMDRAELSSLLLSGFMPGFRATRLRLKNSLTLAGLTISGSDEDGLVQIQDAYIAGELDLTDARLDNRVGPAVNADGIYVGGALRMQKLWARGVGESGAVRVRGAKVSGRFTLQGATVTNESGSAVVGEELRVGDVAVMSELTATSAGDMATLRLTGAHVGGELTVHGELINSDQGPILDLRDGSLDGTFTVGGDDFWKQRLVEDPPPKLLLDGFTYKSPPTAPHIDLWLQVIRKCQPRYTSQPYRQLATACGYVGEEEAAKTVLIAKENEARRRVDRRATKLWKWISWVTVAYGYRPGRALWWLGGVMLASCVLMIWADMAGLLRHPTGDGGQPCGVLEAVTSSIDRSVPLVQLGTAGRCQFTDTSLSQTLFALTVLLQVASWAFVTLFVAGFTGVVKKASA